MYAVDNRTLEHQEEATSFLCVRKTESAEVEYTTDVKRSSL